VGRPYAVRNPRWVTLPNLLSLIRVLLLPPSLWALARQEVAGTLPVALTLTAAFVSDALDGLFARWRGWVSDLGRVLDPLADKIYLGGLVLYLALERDFPLWLVGVIVARDLFLIVAASFLVRRYNIVFAANFWGKTSTVILMALVVAVILRVKEVIPWLVGAALVALLLSLAAYVRDAMRFLRGGAARAV
jgi:CDP-diacylglycerol--glycerol-3-phosphate 3-phosphatidyltransferase